MVNHTLPASGRRPQWVRFRVGDLVTTRTGYPTLYEVICLHADGILRVRGLAWAPGFSALIDAHSVRLVTGLLEDIGSTESQTLA